MKLYAYWLGLHPLDWEFCFMPVPAYKNFITEQYQKKPAFYLRPWRIGIRPRTMLPCVAPQ